MLQACKKRVTRRENNSNREFKMKFALFIMKPNDLSRGTKEIKMELIIVLLIDSRILMTTPILMYCIAPVGLCFILIILHPGPTWGGSPTIYLMSGEVPDDKNCHRP